MYLVIGSFGLATYIFTAVFVYMSEKDLEHYTSGVKQNEESSNAHARSLTQVLPDVQRTSATSEDSISFEQFRKAGFVEIDLERQSGIERAVVPERLEPKDRKKPRLILFN